MLCGKEAGVYNSNYVEVEDIDLYQSYYLIYFDEFEDYMWNGKKTREYNVRIIGRLKDLFKSGDVRNITDVRKFIKKFSNRRINTAFRLFVKFLYEESFIPIRIKRDLLDSVCGTNKSNPDDDVPTDIQLKETFDVYCKHAEDHEILLFLIMAFSGARWTEVQHMIRTFSEKNITYKNKIASYKMLYIRSNKNCNYILMHEEIMKEVIINIDLLKMKIIDKFAWCVKKRLLKDSGIVVINYNGLRKIFRSKLVEYNVTPEFVFFMAGHTQKQMSVGMRSYQEKQFQSITEYLKVVNFYVNIFFKGKL